MNDNNTLNSLDYQSSSPEVETEQDTKDHALLNAKIAK